MISTAAHPARRSQRVYPGRADQVRRVRRDVARDLGGCPVTDDAVLVASEIASNAVLHSRSRGDFFVMRVELHSDHALISCEDVGGIWRIGRPDDRPHGLQIIEALAGPDGWGVERGSGGDRVVWARLSWEAGAVTRRRRREMIPQDQAAIVAANIRVLRQRRGWTQPKVGELMGWLDASTVCAAEGHRAGRQRGFTTGEVKKLAAIFGVSPEQLMTRCVTCGGHPPTGFACLACRAVPGGAGPAASAPACPVPDGHAAARA